MAVSENDLVVGPLTPAAGVTTISLDFDGTGWEAGWLEVYKSGSETPLVLNTDYTVANAGTINAVVTLATPANGNDSYSVYLVTPLQRSSDMQLRGEFKSDPFNVEMDRIWQAMQGIDTRLGRTLRVSRTSNVPTPLFSDTAAERSDRVLKFSGDGSGLEVGPTETQVENAQGYAEAAETARDKAQEYRDKAREWAENPEGIPVEVGQYSSLHHARRSEAARDIAAGFASDIVSQGNVPIYASVATVSTVPIPVGITAVRTNGFAVPGDGGNALYKRVDTEPSHGGRFQSGDGSWWELVPENGYVRPEQFGAKADGVTDDSAAFVAALEMGNINPVMYYKATWGIELRGEKYYLGTTTLQIKATTHIVSRGGSAGAAWPTELIWAPLTTGIIVQRYNTWDDQVISPITTGGDGTVIEGVLLKGGGANDQNGVTDRLSGHGIWLRARATIINVSVIEFPGDGIRIEATAGGHNNVPEGNANLFRLDTVQLRRNGGNGLFVLGADVNAGVGVLVNASQNGRWGIYDYSFLGNTYVGCHTAGNGTASGVNPANSSSFVSYDGVRYAAKTTATLQQLVDIQPGTDASVWVPIGNGTVHAEIPLWQPGQAVGTYFHGGSYYSGNPNARNCFVGCYSESGQGANALLGPCLAIGGAVEGAGFTDGGSFLGRDGGVLEGRGLISTDANLQARFGAEDSIGTVLRWRHTADNEADPWRLHRRGADFVIDNANASARTALTLTGQNTTVEMGTGTPQPYLAQFNTLAYGAGIFTRRKTKSSSAAPTSGVWARGDIIESTNVIAGGKLGWVCTTAGTAGSTAVFKQFGVIDA